MAVSLPVLPPEVRGGSDLCIACGLCCTGLLHEWAPLHAEDGDLGERLALEVVPLAQGGAGFPLPCHHLRGTLCRVYPGRPRACGDYYCDLLRRYLLEEITIADALTVVGRARAMIEEVEAAIGGAPSGKRLWQRVSDYLEAGRAGEADGLIPAEHGPFALRVFELGRLCREHFVPEQKHAREDRAEGGVRQ